MFPLLRKLKKLSLLITTLCLFGCRSASPGANDSDVVLNEHLSYYGFAVVDCGWDAPSDDVEKTNYVDEITGFANVGQLCVYSPHESLVDRLDVFSQAEVKAILHVEAILFEHHQDATIPTGIRIALRSDAQSRWEAFVALNKDVLVSKRVAAIYVVDEPVWNGLSRADFEAALQIVKTTLPNIPTMAIEAYPVVNQVMVPETLDWVGFDRYDSVDPARDVAWLADLDTIRAARTRSDQKIVIVASTQWLPYYQADADISPDDMGAIIESYYQVAVSYPDVIALIGYLWPGGLDDPEQLGARDLPGEAQQRIRDVGFEIGKQ